MFKCLYNDLQCEVMNLKNQIQILATPQKKLHKPLYLYL